MKASIPRSTSVGSSSSARTQSLRAASSSPRPTSAKQRVPRVDAESGSSARARSTSARAAAKSPSSTSAHARLLHATASSGATSRSPNRMRTASAGVTHATGVICRRSWSMVSPSGSSAAAPGWSVGAGDLPRDLPEDRRGGGGRKRIHHRPLPERSDRRESHEIGGGSERSLRMPARQRLERQTVCSRRLSADFRRIASSLLLRIPQYPSSSLLALLGTRRNTRSANRLSL